MKPETEQQLEERLEGLRKKREGQYLEVLTFRQSLAIAESLLAALDGEIVLAKTDLLQLQRTARPAMTAAQHNAFEGGRW